MLIGSWFEIKDTCTDESRLCVVLKGKSYNLSQEDVEYLGINVDGHATCSGEPPVKVGYMLYGDLIIVSNEEWCEFIDGLQSTGMLGGGCAFAGSQSMLGS